MTREELKQYITEAVDAMEQDDLEQLFPPSQQPDLYSVIKELVGLRGEVRKLAQSTSEMNSQIRDVLEHQKERNVPETMSLVTSNVAVANDVDHHGMEVMMTQVVKHDRSLKQLQKDFENLPELTMWSQSKFQKKFTDWKMAYEMAQKEWQQLLSFLETNKVQLQGD